MNPLIERIYATGMVEDDQGQRYDLVSAIKYAEGRALYELIRTRKAARTLEVGMAYGLSTLFMCQAHADNGSGFHTAVDPRQSGEWQSLGIANVRKAGLESFCRIIEAPSDSALPKLVADGENFDLVFIDGKHLFDFVLVDFYYSDKLLKPNGCIVFHDYWMPAVRKAISFVLHNRNYRVVSNGCVSRCGWLGRGAGFMLNLLQNHSDVFSLKLVLAAAGSNYCVLEKCGEQDRPDGHFRQF